MADPQLDERSIFLAAIEIDSPQERNKYLDGACANDAQLRTDVEALLREHETSQGLLDTPDRATPAGGPAGRRLDGQALGDFRILTEIARGGMGVVYEAEQQSLDSIVASIAQQAWHTPTSSPRWSVADQIGQTAADLHRSVAVVGQGQDAARIFPAHPYQEGDVRTGDKSERSRWHEKQTMIRTILLASY